MIHRSFRYRLCPTPEQAAALAQFAGAARFVYNIALEQRRDFWRSFLAHTGKRLDFVTQGHEVTLLRQSVDWLREIPSSPLLQTLRDLDAAFVKFFRGESGYPTPRRKGRNESFRLKAADYKTERLNAKWSAVRIPKLGWVKFRDTRAVVGRALNATISLRPDGWHVSFSTEIEHDAPASDLPAIGIDRGVVNTLALSNGEMLIAPRTAPLEQRKRRLQRVLSRRQRGSKRRAKAQQRLGRVCHRIADTRADWRHKATLTIAQRFGMVALEALRVASMTRSGRRKRGLNRAILEQGWGDFERTLSYKLEERGGLIIKVDPAYTSQACSDCGAIDSRNRESQARGIIYLTPETLSGRYLLVMWISL